MLFLVGGSGHKQRFHYMLDIARGTKYCGNPDLRPYNIIVLISPDPVYLEPMGASPVHI